VRPPPAATGASTKDFPDMMKPLALLLLALSGLSLSTASAMATESSNDSTRPSSPPGPGWALDRINQASLPLDGAATRYLDASGVTAYVVDGGVYESTDEFGTRLRQGFTAFADATGAPRYTDSLSWHGTAVASLLGGRVYGVAKNVNLVSVKVVGEAPATIGDRADALIRGLEFVLLDPLFPDNHRKVVNISLLIPPSKLDPAAGPAIDTEVRKLINAGITVVVGAGNGVDEHSVLARAIDACNAGTPAHLGLPNSEGLSTITVSATMLVGGTQDARVERPCPPAGCGAVDGWYANYGSCVDLFAPGDRVDAFKGPDPYAANDTVTGKFDGTSAATPYVSGLVAHLLAGNGGNFHPPRSPAQIEEQVKALATRGSREHPLVDKAMDADPDHPTGFLRLPGVPGDFDNDGNTDLLLHNDDIGNVAAWLMGGTTYQSTFDLPGISNTQYQIGGAADFDRDGDPDILWNNAVSGANAIWRMHGLSLQGVVDLPTLPPGFTLAGTGDFNGDGKSDILVRNEAGSFAAIWLLDDMTQVGTVNLPDLPAHFELSGAGDFSGDGKPDIVWHDRNNGNNAVWVMNGTSFSGSILNLPAQTQPGYRIGAVADYNGDGKPDIVWRNPATGIDTIWIMNGAVLSQVTALPTLTLSAWDIDAPK
jgi:subtilisin family serine protease